MEILFCVTFILAVFVVFLKDKNTIEEIKKDQANLRTQIKLQPLVTEFATLTKCKYYLDSTKSYTFYKETKNGLVKSEDYRVINFDELEKELEMERLKRCCKKRGSK